MTGETHRYKAGRSRPLKAGLRVSCLWALLLAGADGAQQPGRPDGQTPAVDQAPASGATNAGAPAGGRFKIGPGDVLEIRVFNRPQLSREAVRVDDRGMIRLPLIENDVRASCRSEAELADDIAAGYRKYLRNPHVDVFVKEYHAQPVAVIGAVNAPGRFELQRRVRLVELLTFAGGPTERAGQHVQVIRAAARVGCGAPPASADDSSEPGLLTFTLEEALKNSAGANPYVQPGDIVSIPEAEQIYVVGNVVKPGGFSLKETTTVSKAIALAGGALPDTKGDKVRVLRYQLGSTGQTEIVVNLNAIRARKADDVVLQAGDIVEVPTSEGKRFLRGLMGTVAPGISRIPSRVIP